MQSIQLSRNMVDEKLNWKYHINQLCKKISRGAWAIWQLRNCVDLAILKQIYYSMVHTHLQYCIICWGKACNNSLDPLIKLQKRIIRVMTFSNRLTPSLPLFHELQFLKIEDIYKLEICKEMHKIQTKSTNQLSLNSIQAYTTIPQEIRQKTTFL